MLAKDQFMSVVETFSKDKIDQIPNIELRIRVRNILQAIWCYIMTDMKCEKKKIEKAQELLQTYIQNNKFMKNKDLELYIQIIQELNN